MAEKNIHDRNFIGIQFAPRLSFQNEFLQNTSSFQQEIAVCVSVVGWWGGVGARILRVNNSRGLLEANNGVKVPKGGRTFALYFTNPISRRRGDERQAIR